MQAAGDPVDARNPSSYEVEFEQPERTKGGKVGEWVAEWIDYEGQRLEGQRRDLDETREEF
jgi:hypothetical protein